MSVRNWLNETQAADVMVKHVITLHPNQPLAEAAALFHHEQISGAPVVADDGRCVGVLSESDLVGAEEKAAAEVEQVARSSFWSSHLALPASVYAAKLAEVRDKIAPASEQPVEKFMTTDLVSVTEQTLLATVVADLVEAHIHRVVVLDVQQRLRGLISTTDILAALLRAT